VIDEPDPPPHYLVIQVGGLSSDPRERAVQLGLAPESAEIDVEIRYRGRYPDTVLLQALTLRAMRWIERRFKFLPVDKGMHRSAIFRVPVKQVDLALTELRAAGLNAMTVQ